MTRSEEDLWRAFGIQRDALQISALAFDAGHYGEAVRLANAVFILIGRKAYKQGERVSRSRAVLDQLGLLDWVRLPSTVPEGGVSGSPLYYMDVQRRTSGVFFVRLVPRGRAATYTGRALPLAEWWGEVVMSDSNKPALSLTRGQIVRWMRNQDGGAHFDETLSDPSYAAAVRGELSGFNLKVADGEAVSAHFSLEVSMRQIAEEVRSALDAVEIGHRPEAPSGDR